MSRYEFALAIAEAFGFPKSLVKPISTAEVGYRAPRPRDSSLVSRWAVEMLGVSVDDVNYALSIFKKEWLEQSHASG
jgi:dTDP-4-dehydrorhamnose reductase